MIGVSYKRSTKKRDMVREVRLMKLRPCFELSDGRRDPRDVTRPDGDFAQPKF